MLRIAILGDSFTEGREVGLAETFWKVMEAKVAACLPDNANAVEALGFGVNGYGTAQEYLVLETSVWAYDPDIVLLAVFTGKRRLEQLAGTWTATSTGPITYSARARWNSTIRISGRHDFASREYHRNRLCMTIRSPQMLRWKG